MSVLTRNFQVACHCPFLTSQLVPCLVASVAPIKAIFQHLVLYFHVQTTPPRTPRPGPPGDASLPLAGGPWPHCQANAPVESGQLRWRTMTRGFKADAPVSAQEGFHTAPVNNNNHLGGRKSRTTKKCQTSTISPSFLPAFLLSFLLPSFLLSNLSFPPPHKELLLGGQLKIEV